MPRLVLAGGLVLVVGLSRVGQVGCGGGLGGLYGDAVGGRSHGALNRRDVDVGHCVRLVVVWWLHTRVETGVLEGWSIDLA